MSRNPKSLAARSQVDSLGFRAWFGCSQVTDGEGKPLVVFHGTDEPEDFDSFEVFGSGAWFAQDEYTANGYTGKSGQGADRVIPVYLRIEAPLLIPEDIDMSDECTKRHAIKRINAENGTKFKVSDLGLIAERDDDSGGDHSAYVFLTSEEFLDAVVRAGYDGLRAYEGGYLTWCAFDPSQIKSSLGNNGNFDLGRPEICKSEMKRAVPR